MPFFKPDQSALCPIMALHQMFEWFLIPIYTGLLPDIFGCYEKPPEDFHKFETATSFDLPCFQKSRGFLCIQTRCPSQAYYGSWGLEVVCHLVLPVFLSLLYFSLFSVFFSNCPTSLDLHGVQVPHFICNHINSESKSPKETTYVQTSFCT